MLTAAAAAFVTLTIAAGPARADTVDIDIDSPLLDRWMYPFNATPGSRPSASTFGNFVDDSFDQRDGQFVFAFDTEPFIAPGGDPDTLTVTSATVRIMVENSATIFFNPTPKSYTAFLPPDDPDYDPDPTPGFAIILNGTGFRNGFDALSFQENTPYSPFGAFGQYIRSAYALGYADDGETIDISNSVQEAFDPVPFAVGMVEGLEPGDVIPQDSIVTFEVNIDDPDVQAYLREALTIGRLYFTVTSLHPVEPMAGDFPSFYTKENVLVINGQAIAPQLELTVDIGGEPCATGDLDCNGTVDGADLAILLGAWGECAACEDCLADLDGNCTVDGADLAILLGNWG